MKKILIIGPFPEPTTGVSLANKVVSGILGEEQDYVVTNLNTSFNKFDEKIGEFSWDKLFFNLKFSLSIFKIFGKDVIYITPGQTFFGVAKYFLFFILPWLLGKEIIFHVHGNHLGKEYSQLSGIKKKVFHFILSRAKKGIVLSKSLTCNVTPFVPENGVFVLNNFAQDFKVFSNLEPTLDKKGLRIIFLSNLMKEKGINDLLEALLVLESKGIKYEAKIAGNIDAENKEYVKSKLDKLKNTEYIGVVHGQDKVNLLSWGNVFVLPTYYQMEGQPISILEAMASKCIVVTTNHAGIPDVISNNVHGLFVEKQDPDSIVEVMETIIAKKKQFDAMGNSNREEYLIKYTVEVFGENLLQILK